MLSKLALTASRHAAGTRCNAAPALRRAAAAYSNTAFGHKVPAAEPWSGAREYDVAIVGGGVTGTALLYSLARYTNLERIALIERRDDLSQVASKASANSQTIHCGDIETNYTYAKAAQVSRQADMLRNFATKLPADARDRCVHRMPKMALGVGPEECDFIERRQKEFLPIFPRMTLLDGRDIERVEPKVMEGRKEDVRAIYVEDEHTAVDYYQLAHAFVDRARELASLAKRVDVLTGTSVESITDKENGTKTIATDKGLIRAKYVVVSACGYSLLFAQRMGYGLQYAAVPMAGSFYFVPGSFLNGKVYTCQNPKLPFAAVHGDPDIAETGRTRFGPTALMLPMLERFNSRSIPDFFRVWNPDMDWMRVVADLMLDSTIRNYVLRNYLFEIPQVNTRLFASDARKIIPSLKHTDLTYANGFGGVRPQLIDKQRRALTLGEGRIETDAGMVFNITPSPGGTTCLGTAEKDLHQIVSYLGADFDAELLAAELLQGEYALQEAPVASQPAARERQGALDGVILRQLFGGPTAEAARRPIDFDDFTRAFSQMTEEEERAWEAVGIVAAPEGAREGAGASAGGDNLRHVFAQLDRDGNGSLDAQKVLEGIQSLQKSGLVGGGGKPSQA